MALADRPHRAALTTMADRLRRIVKLDSNGEIDGQPRSPRARRTSASHEIYAALLRTQRFGNSAATADTLFGKLAPLRESAEATVRLARRSLCSGRCSPRSSKVTARRARMSTSRGRGSPGCSTATWTSPHPGSSSCRYPQHAGRIRAWCRSRTRSALRAPGASSVVAAAASSGEPRRSGRGMAGGRGLRQHSPAAHHRASVEGIASFDTRIPLPPGVTLGAPTKGAAQVQGVLAVRQSVDPTGAVIEVPVRFGLAGKMTAPEATARIARASSAPATAPARALVVR